MLAVDMSNFTDPLSPTALQGLKDAEVAHVIVQAIDPPPGYPPGHTRAQIQACLDAGLSVDAYVWLWFDLDANDIRRKLHLLDGLTVRQLWLDVEDTASANYDQATCERKVREALAACDAFPTTSGARTGIYSGRWFWLDRRYMGNTGCFADRVLWDANYDDVADARMGWVPYGGWQNCAIKQYRGTTSIAGIGGLDLNVLSVELESQLAGLTPRQSIVANAQPQAPGSGEQAAATQPDEQRQTSDDWQWSTWREAAIQYRAIADELGQQLLDPGQGGQRQTPDDWQWPSWREAAIQYKAIADELGKQLAAAQAPVTATG